MRVLHLSTFEADAGAGIAAYRLHAGLRQAGVDSRMLVLDRRGSDPTVIALRLARDPVRRLLRRLKKEQIRRDLAHYKPPGGYERFRDDRSEHGPALLRQLPPTEIITLHWINGLVDYVTFFAAAPRRAPLVWRLADMSPFTGGCHYDYGCGRFAQQCGCCPQLGSDDPGDLSARVLRRKADALAGVPSDRLHIVAPSTWTGEMARRSRVLGRFPITVIPNGLDLTVFAPVAQGEARARLGLPVTARVVMFVAAAMDNRRKGFALLAEAVAGLQHEDPDLLLVSVGRGEPRVEGTPLHHLGYISDDRHRALVYAAADLFVIPSLQESFGQTVIEAMACGTPVVGFAAGGIPDMVRPGQTGLLAPVGDTAALRSAIQTLLQDEEGRIRMGRAARALAEAEYASPVQAARYLALYRKLLGEADERTVTQGAEDVNVVI
jgi:glycosyltransferase involved in cell wall biosynthesis